MYCSKEVLATLLELFSAPQCAPLDAPRYAPEGIVCREANPRHFVQYVCDPSHQLLDFGVTCLQGRTEVRWSKPT